MVFKFIIPEKFDGSKLINVLLNNFNYLNQKEWEKEILNNNLLLNSQFTNPESIVKKNDIIEFTPANFIEPPVDFNYKILYEDDFFYAIGKSGDIPIHPSGRYKNNTLLTKLENDFGIKLFSINRIDRETSGIVLFAKSGEIASKFHKLFQLRNIYKEYIVYVTGEFPEYKACRGEIVKDENSKIRKKKKFIFSENFTCSTEFYNLESKFLFSKLKVIPLTGKIHQIRATLFSIGFPVVGDKIYGEDENYFLDFIEGKPIPEFPIARQALHSHKIKFIHPVTKVVIEIISPEPEDMKNIFKQAEK